MEHLIDVALPYIGIGVCPGATVVNAYWTFRRVREDVERENPWLKEWREQLRIEKQLGRRP